MQKYLIILFVLIVASACKKEKNHKEEETPYVYTGALGDIIAVTREDVYSPDQVSALLPSSISFYSHPKFSVRVFTVQYKSQNKDGDTVKTSGVIIVPKADSLSVPLVSYQHGTVLRKSDAPSVSRGGEFLLNLALSSDQGVVTCVTDYLGLGTGDGLHLYLNPKEEANSVRDILRCTRKLVRDSSIATLNGQVFLLGYSQGGHATMAAQRQLELENANEFKLAGSAPMAGPYALSRTSQFNVILDSVYYPNPFYMPYLAVSLFKTYPNVYSSYNQLFVEPYASYIPTYIDGYHSSGQANSKFNHLIEAMIQDSVKIAVRNNPNHPLRLACRGYDLVDDWTPTTPMKLYHCHGDDNVYYSNSVYADSVFKARGANIELIDMGDANHGDCAPSAIVAATSWIETLFKIVRIK